MFSPQPIGHVKSPYQSTKQIPKGFGVKHEAEGVLEILPQFEAGLTDIEGFSHLIVLWVFDRSEGFELLGTPPIDDRPHGVFATRSPRRPNPIGLTVVELLRREKTSLHVRGIDMARWNSDSRSQTLSVQHPAGSLATRLAGRGRIPPPKIARIRVPHACPAILAG